MLWEKYLFQTCLDMFPTHNCMKTKKLPHSHGWSRCWAWPWDCWVRCSQRSSWAAQCACKKRAWLVGRFLSDPGAWWVERAVPSLWQHVLPAWWHMWWTGTPWLAAVETVECGSLWGSQDGSAPVKYNIIWYDIWYNTILSSCFHSHVVPNLYCFYNIIEQY